MTPPSSTTDRPHTDTHLFQALSSIFFSVFFPIRLRLLFLECLIINVLKVHVDIKVYGGKKVNKVNIMRKPKAFWVAESYDIQPQDISCFASLLAD